MSEQVKGFLAFWRTFPAILLILPTGVPRVWEKIEEKLLEVGRNNRGIKKAVADWAKAAALEHHTQRMAGKEGGAAMLFYRVNWRASFFS